jgi:hypothetical protein
MRQVTISTSKMHSLDSAGVESREGVSCRNYVVDFGLLRQVKKR